MGFGIWAGLDAPAVSGGETRTVSLYQVHTGESLTVTYKQNGKYIPSAMKKINYLLRDWRRKETIAISTKTIDLMWELHADLGSKRPIHIVSGYRSPKTNAFLKRIGRNVARKSQHMAGKAIDLYFPDVPTEKIRNSALVRRVGGVGYYRSGGGPTGFVHIDSGKVRHWGPAISSSQMARIMRDYRKTVGARINKKGMIAVASVEADATAAGLPSQQDEKTAKKLKAKQKIPLDTDYSEDDENLAELSADASEAPVRPKSKPELAAQPEPVAEVPEGIVNAYPVPKPRPKPIEVLMMAAVNMKIEPASAPPPTQMVRQKPSPVDGNSLGVVEAAETLLEPSQTIVSTAGKGSLTGELIAGQSESVPVIRTITASAAGDDLFWWPQQLVFNSDKAVRRDGAPQPFGESLVALLPGIDEAAADPAPAMPRLAVAAMPETAAGKGDSLVINRQGKGSLLMTPPTMAKRLKLGQLQSN